jgi:hypothetical protein
MRDWLYEFIPYISSHVPECSMAKSILAIPITKKVTINNNITAVLSYTKRVVPLAEAISISIPRKINMHGHR